MERVAAKDEIYAVVKDAWPTIMQPIVGTNHELRYYGINYPSGVNVLKYWGRVSTQTVAEDQETLRNGTRRFRTDGLVFVQLFAPIDDKQAATRLDAISDAIRNLFRHCTAADNVQFSRARIVDNIDPEAAWLKANVVSEFEYNQFV